MLRMKLFAKTIAMVVAASICVGVFTGNVDYNLEPSAKTIAEMQADQKKLEKEKAALQKKINATSKDMSKEKETQSYISSKIEITEKNIQNIEAQLAALNANIAVTSGEIDAKLAEIDVQQGVVNKGIDDFKLRLRAMYMAGEDNMAGVLVGSNDFYDLLANMDLVERMSKRDEKLISDLKMQLEELNAAKAELEAKKADFEAEKAVADATKATLDSNKSELDSDYQKSTDEVNKIKKEMEDYKRDKAKIDKEEAALEKEIQRQIQELANKNDTYVGGEMLWPLPGYSHITSTFGMRTLYGVTKGHKGIDISGSSVHGKPIVAAQSGKVIVAQTNYTKGVSYGKYVMIDHGGNMVTLYGHCSSLNVSVGQTVKRGDTIAFVGNTGNSYGAHLHFEVRKNGTAVNPLPYVKK